MREVYTRQLAATDSGCFRIPERPFKGEDMKKLSALATALALVGALGATPAQAQQKFVTIGTGGVTGVY
jgi:hypothetical protein